MVRGNIGDRDWGAAIDGRGRFGGLSLVARRRRGEEHQRSERGEGSTRDADSASRKRAI